MTPSEHYTTQNVNTFSSPLSKVCLLSRSPVRKKGGKEGDRETGRQGDREGGRQEGEKEQGQTICVKDRKKEECIWSYLQSPSGWGRQASNSPHAPGRYHTAQSQFRPGIHDTHRSKAQHSTPSHTARHTITHSTAYHHTQHGTPSHTA